MSSSLEYPLCPLDGGWFVGFRSLVEKNRILVQKQSLMLVSEAQREFRIFLATVRGRDAEENWVTAVYTQKKMILIYFARLIDTSENRLIVIWILKTDWVI